MPNSISIFWFRRDLRLEDNAGLHLALKSGYPVLPLFIFDTNILNDLANKKDKRISFIHNALTGMQRKLQPTGSSLDVRHGSPQQLFKDLVAEYSIAAVYTNSDYEPYARKRDKEVQSFLEANGIAFIAVKDQVIFEKDEVLKDNGSPYTVFTPYSRKWREQLNDFYLKPYPNEKYAGNFYKYTAHPIPSLQEIGFEDADPGPLPAFLDESIAANYDKTRDFPGQDGTTRLSVHLRFGTLSIRSVAAAAKRLNDTLLSELIWREFYQMILWHFPHVVTESFKKEYDKIKWRNNDKELELWKRGMTGYPIVDAGMRQLNDTGYMHNRVRMIVGSFLTKHLLIDWRLGEAYFAEKLLDYDLAANNGGWQWAAGSGCDAAPYFRIFNPYLQTQKFDPDLKYIRRWVPELDDFAYPPQIVEHAVARDRCLKVYKEALK